jgi:hypothetical protein
MLSTSLLAVSTVITFLSYTILHRIFFHALSPIPGPPLARITKLWLVWHVRQGKSHTLMPGLHARYGPIVRIAPDQVLVCSEDAIRQAYSSGTKFTKGDWYHVCEAPRKGTIDERLDLLTETDMEKYKMQRRAIGPAYSVAGMEKHEAALDRYINAFISKIQSLNGEEVDLAEWMHIYSLDALSHVVLSNSLDYTAQGSDGGNGAASESIWSLFTTLGLFPGFVWAMHAIPYVGTLLILPASFLLGLGMPRIWPVMAFVVPGIMTRLQALESTKDVKMVPRTGFSRGGNLDAPPEAADVGNEDGNGEEDMMASLLALHHDKSAKFAPSWVLGIALTNFGAGHDTIMITMAICIFNLATHPEYISRLRREMQEQNITKESGYAEIVRKVPLFLAVLKESLRIYPAISFFLPRVVPAGGATVANTYLSQGTTMGISLWATHHDPHVFPEPNTFKPERWLQDGTEGKTRQIARMNQVWMGFGGQSRSCPGQNLARFFVVKGVKRIIESVDLEVSGEVEFRGWFATQIRGVGVKFLPRS